MSFRMCSTRLHLTVIVALASVALALLVVLPLKMATDSLENQARANLAELVGTNAMAIDMQVQATSGHIEDIVAIANRNGDRLDAISNADLEALAKTDHDVRRAVVADASGNVLQLYPDATASKGATISDRDYFRRALSSQGSITSGLFTSKFDQEPTQVVAVAQAIRDANGEVVGVVAASIQANQGFERWVESASARQQGAVVLYDVDGDVIAGNPPSGTDFRTGNSDYISAESPVGSTGWTIAAYVDRDKAFSSINDLRMRTIAFALVIGAVLLVGALSLAREMRARSRAEQDLFNAQSNLSNVMDASDQMLFELDAEGRIVWCNAAVSRITGFDQRKLTGQIIWEAVVPHNGHDRSKAIHQDFLDSTDKSAWHFKTEGQMKTKNGDENLFVEVQFWTTSADGNPRIFVIVNDITKRKKLERDRETVLAQQRQLVSELRQADKTKSDFVSTVSHELRTPLTSIVGYLEMLTEGYGGDLNDQQTSMLSVVDRNSRRLLGLIEDLLTLSRIEARNFRVEHFDLDLGHLVVHTVQAMIPSATEKSLELNVEVDPKIGIVRGDQNQLERVMLNLLSNAVKFTPESGTISVRLSPADAGVLLEVQDTGIGISAEEQTRLFSRFFRSSEVQERAIQGTGLGLAIVKSIVTLHEGTIDVRSEHGVGTTVRVWLPLSEVPVEV